MPSTAVASRKREEPQAESSIVELIAKNKGKPGALLGILEEAQNLERFKYLSEPTLRLIAEGMGVPLSQVFHESNVSSLVPILRNTSGASERFGSLAFQ